MFGKKCHLYFPLSEDSPVETKSFLIKKSFPVFQNSLYRISCLEIECKETQKKVHRVFHYHINNWTDLGVISQSNETHFMDLVKTVYSALHKKPQNPVLFHCSAGVGRTGTFLMIFFMYQMFLKLKKKGELDKVSIFNEIVRLRHQRKFFAETKDQYKFIYSFLKRFNE